MSNYGTDYIFMVVSWAWIEYWKCWVIGLIVRFFEVTFGTVLWGGSSGYVVEYINFVGAAVAVHVYIKGDLGVWYIVLYMLTDGAVYDHWCIKVNAAT